MNPDQNSNNPIPTNSLGGASGKPLSDQLVEESRMFESQPSPLPAPGDVFQVENATEEKGLKKIITIIIAGIFLISGIGLAAILLLIDDDPVTTNQSSGSSDILSLVTNTIEHKQLSVKVPINWTKSPNLVLDYIAYTSGSTNEESNSVFLYGPDPLISIPGFESYGESELEEFSEGFFKGYEPSFRSTASQAGGTIRTFSGRRIVANGSKLVLDFDYSGVNAAGLEIEGKGRFLVNDAGEVFGMQITALSDTWQQQEAELTSLLNGMVLK